MTYSVDFLRNMGNKKIERRESRRKGSAYTMQSGQNVPATKLPSNVGRFFFFGFGIVCGCLFSTLRKMSKYI